MDSENEYMKTMDQPLVSVVTVGMNHFRFIRDLYFSLFKDDNTKPNFYFEAIYVDNCSNDGTVEFIKDEYPEVKIIENQVTCGFGENNNIGVRNSRGKYVAIVNPDIVFLPDCLEQLINYMEQNDRVGIVAPQLLNCDKSIQYSARRFITLKLLFWRLLTRANDKAANGAVAYYLCKNFDFEVVHAVDWVLGAAIIISRDYFDCLGGFDEDYFLYFEDEDLCLRSWKYGRDVVYFPCSKMIHNHLRASMKISMRTIYHLKSVVLFFMKHGVFLRRKHIISYIDREVEIHENK